MAICIPTSQILVFAQAEGPASILQSPFIPLLLIGMVFYFMLLRPERQRRAEHMALLDSLKKNDRVVTNGGVFGTIVNVHKGEGDDDAVVVRIDENNNTRIRVQRSAIARVITQNSNAELEKAGAK